MLSVSQRAVTLKGEKLEYYIPNAGNSSLLTVPNSFSRTSFSLLLLWAVSLFPSLSTFYGYFWQPWMLESHSFVKSRLSCPQMYVYVEYSLGVKAVESSSSLLGWAALFKVACHVSSVTRNGHLTYIFGPLLNVSE